MIGIGVPIRTHSATILSLGIVAARVVCQQVIDLSPHFAALTNQRIGTLMFLEIGGSRFPSVFAGTTRIAGETWLVLVVDGSTGAEERHYVRESESARVHLPIDGAAEAIDVPRVLVRRRRFIRAVFGSTALSNISRESQLECLLVGRRSLISQEACELVLGIRNSEDQIYKGRLSDLLRLRSLLGADQPYRTDIVSTIGRRALGRPLDKKPHTVVFDGATGFLKWRHLWQSSHWIVLLDHTEPRCHEAAEVINRLYADASLGRPTMLPIDDNGQLLDLSAFELAVPESRSGR